MSATKDVLETLQKLPPLCYTRLNSNPKQVIMIRRGVMGYFPIATSATPQELNARLNPSPSSVQIEAMEIGSIMGWHVPGADPDELMATAPDVRGHDFAAVATVLEDASNGN